MPTNNYPMPFTRVELCVLGLSEAGVEVLLARREQAPEKGKWALPGGVLRIELDEDLEGAAQRVAVERLGTRLPSLRLQAAMGGKGRDPRAPWTLSIAYRAMTWAESLQMTPGKRVELLQWFDAEAVAGEGSELAFDHAGVVASALAGLRQDVEDLALPFELLPPEFTLAELQQSCEFVLGRPLDKSSFRRRLDDRQCVEAVPGVMRGAAHRPAQVYRRRDHSLPGGAP